jgi:hypothetical protein
MAKLSNKEVIDDKRPLPPRPYDLCWVSAAAGSTQMKRSSAFTEQRPLASIGLACSLYTGRQI